MLKVFHAAHYQHQRAANVWVVTWVVGRLPSLGHGHLGGVVHGCLRWLAKLASGIRSTQRSLREIKEDLLTIPFKQDLSASLRNITLKYNLSTFNSTLHLFEVSNSNT